MKKSELVGIIATPLMMFALSLPAWADSTPTTCKDGTTSTSTGKGTCSGHGGMQKAGTSAAPAAAAPAAAPAAPAAPAASGATSTCKDGTTSTSTGKGTCSGHGGVQKATPAAPAVAAPAAAKSSTAGKSAPTATASNTDPTGATAKCKDGTYSKSQHRSGTCSSHGGVAQWLTAE